MSRSHRTSGVQAPKRHKLIHARQVVALMLTTLLLLLVIIRVDLVHAVEVERSALLGVTEVIQIGSGTPQLKRASVSVVADIAKKEYALQQLAEEQKQQAEVNQKAAHEAFVRSSNYIPDCEVTAYCSCAICCGSYALQRNGAVITASGAVAEPGRTIAVDPNVIPLGSSVWIDGREYIAQDTGSAVKGYVIDIYVGSHEDAINFGRQHKEIYWK